MLSNKTRSVLSFAKVLCLAITFFFLIGKVLEKTEQRPEPEIRIRNARQVLGDEQQSEYKVSIENEEMLKFMSNILKCRTS